MPSPYRKPHAQRRGGYDTSRELESPTRKAPTVPVSTWPAEVKRWWRGVWANPVAGEWDRVADLPSVRRLGDLYALQANGEPLTAAVLAQVVKLEQELLLTPAARKRAYVRLPDEESDPRNVGPDEATLRRREDRRKRLLRPLDHDEPPNQPYYDAFGGLRLMADGSVIDMNPPPENGNHHA